MKDRDVRRKLPRPVTAADLKPGSVVDLPRDSTTVRQQNEAAERDARLKIMIVRGRLRKEEKVG